MSGVQLTRATSYSLKSSKSSGRKRNGRALVEVSIFLEPETFEMLKARAYFHDNSLSGQVRADVKAGNARDEKLIL